jgi:hypothetical protein
MAHTSHAQPRFTTLSDFFSHEEELATVDELCAIGPWKLSQVRYWLYESERNGLEAALVRPNQRRLYIHSGRFKQWLEDRGLLRSGKSESLRSPGEEKGMAVQNSTALVAGVTRAVQIESTGTDAGSVGNNTPR